MNLDFNLILNFLVAIFFYNIILKTFATVLIKWVLSNNDTAKELKKTFKEKVFEKLKEKEDEKI